MVKKMASKVEDEEKLCFFQQVVDILKNCIKVVEKMHNALQKMKTNKQSNINSRAIK